MGNGKTAAPDAVSRYRDALARGTRQEELASLAAGIDPGAVEVLHLIHEAATAAEMRPSPDFARRLEHELRHAGRSNAAVATDADQIWRTPRPRAGSRPSGVDPVRRGMDGSPPGPPVVPFRATSAADTERPEERIWRAAWPARGSGPMATAAMLAVTLVTALFVSGVWRPGALDVRTWQPAARTVTAPADGRLEFLWRSTGGPEGFRRAYGLAVAPDGRIWVVDWPRGEIAVLDADGSYRESWGEPGAGEGQFNFLSAYFGEHGPRGALDFDGGGNVYVVDTGNARVQKFAPDRTFLLAWGGRGEGKGQFLAPSGIAIDAAGKVYVSDAKRKDVQVFDGDGAYEGVIASTSADAAKLQFPVGIAVDDDGTIWEADVGSDRIRQFAPDGSLLADWGVLGTGAGELLDPYDVAIDAAGRVYVVDLSNRRLQVFTADGRFLATTGGFGVEQGQFSLPAAVAIDEDGVVYVSDRTSVQAFRLVMGDG